MDLKKVVIAPRIIMLSIQVATTVVTRRTMRISTMIVPTFKLSQKQILIIRVLRESDSEVGIISNLVENVHRGI